VKRSNRAKRNAIIDMIGDSDKAKLPRRERGRRDTRAPEKTNNDFIDLTGSEEAGGVKQRHEIVDIVSDSDDAFDNTDGPFYVEDDSDNEDGFDKEDDSDDKVVEVARQRVIPKVTEEYAIDLTERARRGRNARRHGRRH